MPKEITHWLLAERLAKAARDTPFGPALEAEPGCLLLGAVVHDVFFYLTGDGPPGLKDLPYLLHGARGEDPGAFLLAQAAHARRSGSYKAQSLLAGLASHACADAVLHPLVFFQTGHLFSPDPAVAQRARMNHRALESLWDMRLTGAREPGYAGPTGSGEPGNTGAAGVRGWSLKDIADSAGAPFEAVADLSFLARAAGATLEETARAWGKALDTFCLVQSMARNETVARLAFGLFPALPAKVREIVALFYCPQFLDRLPATRGPQAFRQPLTGEESTVTLEDLLDQAVERAEALLGLLAPVVFEGAEPVLPWPLPSLETGLPRSWGAAMTHFASEPVMGL